MDDEPRDRSYKADEITVFMLRTESKCSECGRELSRGNLLRLEGEKALCVDCADLAHLEFLPRGDTALTRRASKYSPIRAVVVQWARARKRYERQGLLLAPEAIRKAEGECLADAEVRERRRGIDAERRTERDEEFIAEFGRKIRELFPGCPGGEADDIAAHACQRYSGRVGRSAMAKQFDPDAIHLAVAAHIRHAHTDYDTLLNQMMDRSEARQLVRKKVEETCERWEKGEVAEKREKGASAKLAS